MKIHFIQHVPFEDPAFIMDWAEKKNYPVSSGRAYLNDPYPDYNEFDLLLIMGGPMSVNDEHLLPWLTTEKKFVKEAISKGKIVVGICLGAQLIASVFGAKVKLNIQKEIGWFPVKFNDTECKRLSLPFSGELMTFHWHGETFDLPEGSVLLASSQVCKNQAFAIGNSVFGFQFHLEANKYSIDRLIFNCESEIDSSLFVQNKEKMISQLHFIDSANSVMEAFLNYIDRSL
jgi:GMP synthase-like glutamine amidotransferase